MADKDEDLLAEAKEAFERCQKDPAQNRHHYEKDTRFVRLREQWPDNIKKLREGRPCLTIDKLGPVIRQVVNDARQNKPSIKVHPVDSHADKKTAEVLDGLIRNIEYSSNADVAYDTAVECAVGGNVGYFRIKADYSHADAFDMDLAIERIANPLSVYPDPASTAADSSDWNECFVVTRISREEYEDTYGEDAEKINWNDDCWKGWADDEGVLIGEWWKREEYEKDIVQLEDGSVYSREQLNTDVDLLGVAAQIELGDIKIANERTAKCWKVTQRKLSGAKVLEETVWPGQYIPIVPVYGDEFWIDGVRYLRSLINGAVDAQQMFNIMRSTATELFGLSPKVPYLLEEGAADVDPNWQTANQVGHPFLEYAKGTTPPIRLPLDPGVATGAMNEALAASDDIKAITGLYDASLGARSNETSGKAIMARQREGDVSTFHFIDNLRRSIRHAGRILVDVIPHFYDKARIVRVIGEDGKQETRQVNQPYPQIDPKTGQPVVDELGQAVMAMHDLRVGKYDVTVSSGPSFTTRREEAAYAMTEAVRAFPMGADVLLPELAKVSDWPGADKISEKLEERASGQIPPQAQQLIEQGKKKLEDQAKQIEQLQQQLQAAKVDQAGKIQEAQIDARTAEMEAMIDAKTKVIVAEIETQARKEIEAFKARLMASAQAARPIVQSQPNQAA